MSGWIVSIAAVGVFVLLVIIQCIVHAKKPVQSALGGILTGICALAAVNVAGVFTGVSIPFSPLAIGVSGVAGIPGVTMLLLLNLILQA